MQNMTIALAKLKEANAANTLRVYAKDMLHAHITLTSEERAILATVADALRGLLGTDEPQELYVPVYDACQETVKLGELRFTL